MPTNAHLVGVVGPQPQEFVTIFATQAVPLALGHHPPSALHAIQVGHLTLERASSLAILLV